MTIAWNVVNDLSIKNEIVEPSEEERIYSNYSGNDYLGKVVTPWYRMLSQRVCFRNYRVKTYSMKKKKTLTTKYACFNSTILSLVYALNVPLIHHFLLVNMKHLPNITTLNIR